MNKRGFDPTILIPNAVLFIAVSFGVIYSSEPLRSIRPATSGQNQKLYSSVGILARPWEDPLTVQWRGGTEEVPSKTASAVHIDQLLTKIYQDLISGHSPSTSTGNDSISELAAQIRPDTKSESNLTESLTKDAPTPLVDRNTTNSPQIATKDRESSNYTTEEVLRGAILESKGELVDLRELIDKKAENDDDSKQEIAKVIQQFINKAVDQPDLLLVVLVPNGFESDAIEKRIRIRQAIMAAMSRAQYLPDHPHVMRDQSVTFGNSSKANLVSDDFIPENLVTRFNGFTDRSLTITTSDDKEIDKQRAIMGDIRRFYERVRVVYVNIQDLENKFPRTNWNEYEVDRMLKRSLGANIVWESHPVQKSKLQIYEARRKHTALVAGLPHSAYSGYLWRTTILGLQDLIKRKSGNPNIDVIGPDTSDELIELLVKESPPGGRDKPLRILSPFASIETDLLLQKLMGKVANSDPNVFGAKMNPSIPKGPLDPRSEDEHQLPWFTVGQPSNESNRTTLKAADHDLHFIHNVARGAEQTNEQKEIENGEIKQRTDIFRMTLSDDHLASTLVKELANRNVDFRNPDSKIVLISESDTIYGNAFPVSFKKQVLKSISVFDDHNKIDESKAKDVIQIQRFSYLRGLDGRTVLDPKAQQAAKQEKKALTEDDFSRLVKDIGLPESVLEKGDPGWRPEGTQQYDRVRALAATLRSELANRNGKVVAVGVVGSDPYDKMVIFQALRPLLPGVIFFTPDLESNYLSDENLPYTRNLLVASTYGLRLHPEIQGSTMPFRDSYQTAVYHSVLTSLNFYRQLNRSQEDYVAIKGAAPSRWQKLMTKILRQREQKIYEPTIASRLDHKNHVLATMDAPDWKPNLYEIGSKGAIPLAKAEDDKRIHANSETISDISRFQLYVFFGILTLFYFIVVWVSCKTRDPKLRFSNKEKGDQPVSRSSRILRALVLTGIAVAGGGAAFSELLESTFFVSGFIVFTFILVSLGIVYFGTAHLGWRRGSYWVLVLFSCTGFLLLGALISHSHNLPGEEPFSLLDGVSAWPSEILRYIGLALGGYYCILASADSRSALRNSRKIINPASALSKGGEDPAIDAQSDQDFGCDHGSVTNTKMFGELRMVVEGDQIPQSEIESHKVRRSGYFNKIYEFIRTEVLEGERKEGQKPRFQGCLKHPGWLLTATLVLISCGILIFFVMGGHPPKPIRGHFARYVDNMVLFGSLSLMYLLTAYAVIHNLYCLTALILPAERGLNRGDIRNASSAEIPLRLVEDFTIRTSRLPLFPCLIIFILILSRSSVLDNWFMPPQIVSMVIFVVGVLIVSDSMISYRARRLKRRVQNILNLEKTKQRVISPQQGDGIDSVDSGVFASFLANPVLRAVMIPIGGGGLLSIIEMLGK